MIVRAEALTARDEFKGMDRDVLASKLKAIENLIRSYTNNNFQDRSIRMTVPVTNGILLCRSPYLEVGDTVQISRSGVNDGLHEILEILDCGIAVNGRLYDHPKNLVTKVVYPAAIQEGVVNLMLWETENRQKVGIKSETLSRHQVTYFDQDANNQVMGYPVSILGFLDPYQKPRF